jgi:hypothetical protein
MLTAAATGARGTGRVMAAIMTPDHEILRRDDPEVTAWSALPADELVNGLFRDHAANLVRIATLLLGDQPSAEDVVQDAFLQLYRSLPRLRDPGKRRLPAGVGGQRFAIGAAGAAACAAAPGPGPACGRYLLVEYDRRSGGTRLARLDLMTGRITQLNAGWAIEAAIAW